MAHTRPRGPLPHHIYHVLLALSDRVLHGYTIIKEIRERTGGAVVLGTSTLYAALARLVEDGLIEQAPRPPGTELDDPRRRYYRLTKAGRRAAKDEARRIRALDRMAVAKRLLPDRGE